MRRFAFAALLCACLGLFGQTIDTAKSVYTASEDAVFLIYLNDGKGVPHALGSAFLVAPRTLVTNAHVVDGGNPVLAIGPVRIPLTVVRMDKKNDLAVLRVDADLTSKPLLLSGDTISPGEEVFAIGNPEGLERTISQGIISGLRTYDGRDLLQVTTPISHGSSGGPILNGKGQVVGVAVGMLDEGQNLNFAVPVSLVNRLLNSETTTSKVLEATEDLSKSAPSIRASRKLYIEERIKTTSGTSTHCDSYGNCYSHENTRTRDVSLELTQEVMKRCPSVLTITNNRETADLDLKISAGNSTMYKQNGDVAFTSPAKYKVSNLAKDICQYAETHP